MGDPTTCIISVIVPCGVVISCAACCVSCCCYFARNVPTRATLGAEGADPTVTEQPQVSYATLKKRMVTKFQDIWATVSKQENESSLPDTLQLEKVDCKENCIICWEGYKEADIEDELVGMIKQCGHYFHFDCLWEWLETHDTCPLCRKSAGLSEDDITGIPLKAIRLRLNTEQDVTDAEKVDLDGGAENGGQPQISNYEPELSKDDMSKDQPETSADNPSEDDETEVSHSKSGENMDIAGHTDVNSYTADAKREHVVITQPEKHSSTPGGGVDSGVPRLESPPPHDTDPYVARVYSYGGHTPKPGYTQIKTSTYAADNPCFEMEKL